MRTTIWRTGLLLFGLVLLGTSALAKPAFQKQYKAYYKGSKPVCATCHSERPKLNEYGTALKEALNGGRQLTPAMFKASEAKRPAS